MKRYLAILLISVMAWGGCSKSSDSSESNNRSAGEGEMVVEVNGKKYVYKGDPSSTQPIYMGYAVRDGDGYHLVGHDERDANAKHSFITAQEGSGYRAIWTDFTSSNLVVIRDNVTITFKVSNDRLSGTISGSTIKGSFNKLYLFQ